MMIDEQQTRQRESIWPALPLAEWQTTLDTLHMWLQVIGKIKLELVPFRNQWWNVTLHPTARGLTTGVIPSYRRAFEIDLDLLDHTLRVSTNDGGMRTLALSPRTVAAFYAELMAALAALGIQVTINPTPVEAPHTILFDTDVVHRDYDPDYVTRWWRILLATTMVLQQYDAYFTGKSSPPQFFWGSFDLSHTRFSGRSAEPPVGAPRFVQLAENEENAACGFWPGNTSMSGLTLGEPAFYAYCYPQPDGYTTAQARPNAAYFDEQFGEFILRYEDVRRSDTPAQDILDFFESTYQIAAQRADWDRARLEFDPSAAG
jgi:hypothetical protein